MSHQNNWLGRLQRMRPSPDLSSRKPLYRSELIINLSDKSNGQNDTLFEDAEFPATKSSLVYDRNLPDGVEWKRPKELSKNARFVEDGFSRFDVRQGELGDCWFLAAVANLTMYPELFQKVISPNQSFEKDYNGTFRFKFWQYGSWIEVYIDDRLPSYAGKLLFMRSAEADEFWSPLLEKAYAKLCGSYEAMKGGSTCEALQDFTGGLTEMYDLRAKSLPHDLYNILFKAMEKRSLIAASIEADSNVKEAKTPHGLVRGHAYSITCMKIVHPGHKFGRKSESKLIRVRNPWGNEIEWNGPWSDNSEEWKSLSDDERNSLGLTFAADGEFWIDYEDFLNNFDGVEICHLDPETADSVQSNRADVHRWECQQFNGSWVRGATAGGCRNNLETFAYNPQYQIQLSKPDDDDQDGKCTIIVALLQKNRRQERSIGKDLLNIGFSIYRVDDPKLHGKKLTRDFFARSMACGSTESFSNLREMSCRFMLPPGTYAIVPSTFDPNQNGEFMLRIFSEKEAATRSPPTGSPSFVMSSTTISTSIDGKDADGFREVDAEMDDAHAYDAVGLQELLNKATKDYSAQPVSLDACRSMIAMYDVCRTGNVTGYELKVLMKDLSTYAKVFKQFDKDKCGTISSFEFDEALLASGYEIPDRILKVLVLRYAAQDSKMHFNDFVKCVVKLKTMTDIFHEYDPSTSGKAQFDLTSFVELTMYT